MIVLLAARYEYDEKAMDYLFELFKTKSNLREAILSSFSSNLGISLQSYRSNFKPQILLLTKCLKLLETDIEFLDVLDVLVKLYLPFEHECSEMQHDKDTQKDVIKIHRFQLPVSNETEKFRELVWSSVKVLYDNGRIGKLLELPYSNVYGANNIDSEFGIAPGLFFYSYYIFNT